MMVTNFKMLAKWG